MKEFKVPRGVCGDAYVSSMDAGGMLPEGMTDGQVSQGVYRKALWPDDYRVVSAGILPCVRLELEEPMTMAEVDRAEEFYSDFQATPTGGRKPFPFPRRMFERIVSDFGGYWPVCILAMRDGQTHKVGEPHIQVFTDVPGMGEAVGWLESTLGPYLWASTIVATRGRKRRERLFEVYKKAHPSMDPAFLWAMTAVLFHDFGRRGAKAHMITGIAHLLNFLGTDTVDAAYAATHYLNGGRKFGTESVHASAHRVVTAFETEDAAIDKALSGHFADIFSQVADTYDYTRCMERLVTYAPQFEAHGGKLVGRPDSGDPCQAVLEGLGIFAQPSLYTSRGFSFTEPDGLKLFTNAGIIQGDGVDDDAIFRIIDEVIAAGFSPLNVAFGMGQHNHKGERSEVEWGFKNCVVRTPDGGTRTGMKRSSSEFKMSLPGPVALNLTKPGPRVLPISFDELLAGRFGDFEVVYDRRPNPFPVTSWTFDDSRELIETSWRALGPEKEDTFDPEIRRMQREFLARIASAN